MTELRALFHLKADTKKIHPKQSNQDKQKQRRGAVNRYRNRQQISAMTLWTVLKVQFTSVEVGFCGTINILLVNQWFSNISAAELQNSSRDL